METLILLGFLIAGLGLILGILQPRTAFNLIMFTIFTTLMLPFISAFVKDAPGWFILILIAVSILLLLQFILSLLFGKSTAASAIGNILSELILLPFRILIELLRGVLFRRRV
jgi:hypothetical protein